MADTTVHVGEGKTKRKAPRWQFVLLLAVVVVAGLGAGAFLRWSNIFDLPEESKPTPLPAVVEEVQDLQLGGKAEEADAKIAELLAKTSTTQEEKFILYVLQGDSFGAKQQFQEAADVYAKAAEIKMTYDLASKLGAVWQGVGDKQKAVQYYKQAIQLLPEDLPTRDGDKQRLEMSIEYLEAH